MNTHESYVSLEAAKLLKQAGFDWPCNHAICCDSTHYPNLKEGDVLEYNYLECSELMEGKKPHMLLCPTLDVAQRWLREAKEMYAEAYLSESHHTAVWIASVYLWENRPLGRELRDKCLCTGIGPVHFDTYEEALEAGIKKCLTLILEQE